MAEPVLFFSKLPCFPYLELQLPHSVSILKKNETKISQDKLEKYLLFIVDNYFRRYDKEASDFEIYHNI